MREMPVELECKRGQTPKKWPGPATVIKSCSDYLFAFPFPARFALVPRAVEP